MKFKRNPSFLSQLKRGVEFQAVLDDAAGAVQQAAEHETPIGATADTIHHYKTTKAPTTRKVGNTDPFFHLTEWGSVNNVAYAPLRRGVQAAGLRLDERAHPDDE